MKIAEHYVTRNKSAFVDPATAAGAAPPEDPAATGGAPPMDPSMGGGAPPMDPSMMGGAPPMDPAMAGGGGDPALKAELEAVKQQLAQLQSGGGTAGAAGKPMKPKVDINTEIYQVKKLLVILMNQLGASIPPDLLLGDPAQDPAIPPEQAAQDPLSSAATQQQSGINPVSQAAPPPGGPLEMPAPPEQTSKAASLLNAGQGYSFPGTTDAYATMRGRPAALLARYRDYAATER